MAAYIAFIATLNLCLGYALGVYFGVMPGITPRRMDEEDEEETFGLTMEPMPAAPHVEPPAPPPNVELADEPAPPRDEAPPAAKDPADILEGLNAFRSKLGTVAAKLSSEGQDRESLDECAGEMKEANNEYLEQTSAVIASLDAEDTVEYTMDEQKLRKLLADQSEEVQRANNEIDEILADDDDESVRRRLLASSEQLSEVADTVEQALPEQAVSPDEAYTRLTGKLDQLLVQIDASLGEDADTLQVAALDLSCGEDQQHRLSRVTAEVANLLADDLDADQSLAVDSQGRLIMTLAGDDESKATARCERIRQRLVATTFVDGTDKVELEVRCALTDTSQAEDRDRLQSRLDESLAEAAKLGESRTFHHDGKMAAPVTTEPLSIEPATVML